MKKNRRLKSIVNREKKTIKYREHKERQRKRPPYKIQSKIETEAWWSILLSPRAKLR